MHKINCVKHYGTDEVIQLKCLVKLAIQLINVK